MFGHKCDKFTEKVTIKGQGHVQGQNRIFKLFGLSFFVLTLKITLKIILIVKFQILIP